MYPFHDESNFPQHSSKQKPSNSGMIPNPQVFSNPQSIPDPPMVSYPIQQVYRQALSHSLSNSPFVINSYYPTVIGDNSKGFYPKMQQQMHGEEIRKPEGFPNKQNNQSSEGFQHSNWIEGNYPVIFDQPRPNTLELSILEPGFNPTEEISSLRYFKLAQQPHEKQRKSYQNENRYILPNPLVICPERMSDSSSIEGTVSVKLVSENCDEFTQEREFLLDGVKLKKLDNEKKVQFSLKILETSEGNKFRLFFKIEFLRDGVKYKQNILSHPFKVTSNKKKSAIEKPKAFALIPKEGYCQTETEVWIKGKRFNDRANIGVTFGGVEARIAETEENILICYAPKRPDLVKDTAVSVLISNTHPQDGKMNCDKPLAFTYLVKEPEANKRRRVIDLN